MEDDTTMSPFARATITPDVLTLNAWNPGLIGLGLRHQLLDGLADGKVLADLRIERREGGNELIVEVIAGDLAGGTAARLLAWACDVGYRRVWLPERIVCLEPDQQPLGISRAECPTCGVSWNNESTDFLAQVRRSGWFPGWCNACGGSLPEWTLEPADTASEMTFGPVESIAALEAGSDWH